MMKSFVYMFEDKAFWKKYLSLFGVLFVANLLVNWSSTFSPLMNDGERSVWYYLLFIAGFICLFAPYGYSISLLKSNLEKGFSDNLPNMDFVNNFVAGLKVVVSGFVLLLLVIILVSVLFMINNFVSEIFGGILSNILNFIMFFVFITLLFLSIAMCCRYVIKPSFLNFVDFKSTVTLINHDVVKYFKSFVLAVLSTVLVYALSMLSALFLTNIGYFGLVLYCVLVSVLWSYQTFVFAGLFSTAVIPEKI